jgi:tetratricopeptide (TPR) repeat protein
MVAALDQWMRHSRQQGAAPRWRRLLHLADRLDPSDRHRQLRALVGHWPRPQSVAALVGAPLPWTALGELGSDQCQRQQQVRSLREQFRADSEPVLTVLLMAQVCEALGEVAAAEDVLRRASAVRPDEVVLLNALGKLLEHQGRARLPEAIECYRAIRARHRNLGVALAMALVKAGRAPEAEAVMRDLVRQQPDDTWMHFNLGFVLQQQNQREEAEAAYRQAISLKPDLALAHSNLGILLHLQNKREEAEAAFRKAISLQPGLAQAHYNLGLLLQHQKKLGEAEAAYRQAILLKPDHFGSHHNLGIVLQDQKKPREAEGAFRKAISLRPDHADAHAGLGLVLEQQNRREEAEAAYRQAISLQPDLAWAHHNLGILLHAQHKLEEAEAAFRQAISLKPDLVLAYDNLGIILQGQHKLEEAEAVFRKAISLQPDLIEVYNDLARVLGQQARFEEAVTVLKTGSALLGDRDPRRQFMLRHMAYFQRQVSLDARLPAVLKGADQLASAAEKFEFARLCADKKLYVVSVRFHRAAFADPNLARLVPLGARYDAACAAALAGCGQGKDAAGLGDTERADLRQQAHDWLRPILTLWSQGLDRANAQARATIAQQMQRWCSDTDLAGVRDEADLAQLPEAERVAWRKLWDDVAALQRRAAAP